MSSILTTTACWLLVIYLALLPCLAQAEKDLFIFPELRTLRINSDNSDFSDTYATIDFFGSVRYDQFRFLGEIFLTEDGIEAERFQLGYDFSALSTAWLGRFHNPLGYWNTQYHHGTYLQTSISRPEIAKFEHNGGLFPSHVSGVLLETGHDINNDGALDFSFAAGTSPELRMGNDQSTSGLVLHPRELFSTGKGNHKLSLTARIIYRPESVQNNQLGFFASQANIKVSDSSIETIDLKIAGLFAYWQAQNLNFYGSLFYSRDNVNSANATDKGSFTSGYMQLDYLFSSDWTVFARVENTSGEKTAPYLALMSNFSPEAQVTGLRWDITRQQAIKFEISRKHTGTEEPVTTILNWAAIFP